MSARIEAWLDQQDAQMTTAVRRHGWFIRYVGGTVCAAPGCDPAGTDDPPFAYTVGLFGMNHAELLIFGVSPAIAAGVLNDLGERVRDGESLLPGMLLAFGDWPHRIIPEEVPNAGEIVFDANRFYRRPDEFSVPVLQLSYDDPAGRFPWDEGYASPGLQPRPGTFRA